MGVFRSKILLKVIVQSTQNLKTILEGLLRDRLVTLHEIDPLIRIFDRQSGPLPRKKSCRSRTAASNAHEVRKAILLTCQILVHPGTKLGMSNRRPRIVVGQHLINTSGMSPLIGLHRVQDENLVHLLGQLWIVIAHPNPVGITLNNRRLPQDRLINFNIKTVVLAQSP